MDPHVWYGIVSKFQASDKPAEVVREGWELGLLGEIGEVCDLLKKHHLHGHPLAETREKLQLELGDVYWYVCALRGEVTTPMFPGQIDLVRVMAGATRWLHDGADARGCAQMITADLMCIGSKFGLLWGYVLQANADKLTTRYKSGRMTTEESVARADVVAENALSWGQK